MPTYREDLHLGHKVPLVETDDICDKAVTEGKLADDAVSTEKVQDEGITEPKLADDAVSTRILQNKSVTEPKIDDGAVSHRTMASDAVGEENIIDGAVKPNKLDPDLLNEIRSAGEHGYALTGLFGDSTLIGIHQKSLTEAFDAVWRKIEEITGEELRGFSWTVTPTYFISETAQTIEVNAAPIIPGLVFEYIAFYSGDTLLVEEENVATFSYSFKLTDTSVIKCVAKILGITYTREETVNHYNNFYLGAGSAYSEIMDIDHVIPVGRGAYNVTVGDNQYIFIIIGETLRSRFIRADINGVEIPFTESSVTVGGRSYKVFTSRNTYNEGEYNIDING